MHRLAFSIVIALSICAANCATSWAQREPTPIEVLQPAEPVPGEATATKILIADTEVVGKGGREAKQDAALLEKFKKLLTGAKLRGQFTVDGKPMDKLTEETYEISKVEKQAEGDLWIITARIKYGKNDLTFPVPIDVKWAGKTPVLTLDNMTIPGFGTFGARVVFHKDKYAGTWQHDDVGGHMFGMIEYAKSDEAEEAEAGEKQTQQ